MIRASTLTRFFRLFIALFHLTVMGAAEIAEARLASEDRFVLHIEADGFDCPIPVHSDQCTVCQALLATPDVEGLPCGLPFDLIGRAEAADQYQPPLPLPAPSDPGLPRAPPALLT